MYNLQVSKPGNYWWSWAPSKQLGLSGKDAPFLPIHGHLEIWTPTLSEFFTTNKVLWISVVREEAHGLKDVLILQGTQIWFPEVTQAPLVLTFHSGLWGYLHSFKIYRLFKAVTVSQHVHTQAHAYTCMCTHTDLGIKSFLERHYELLP